VTNYSDLCPDYSKRGGSIRSPEAPAPKRRTTLPTRVKASVAEQPVYAYGARARVTDRATMDSREAAWAMSRSDRRVRMMFLLLLLQLTRSTVLVCRIVFLQISRAGRMAAKKAAKFLSSER
jgi:hypothetical protein